MSGSVKPPSGGTTHQPSPEVLQPAVKGVTPRARTVEKVKL